MTAMIMLRDVVLYKTMSRDVTIDMVNNRCSIHDQVNLKVLILLQVTVSKIMNQRISSTDVRESKSRPNKYMTSCI